MIKNHFYNIVLNFTKQELFIVMIILKNIKKYTYNNIFQSYFFSFPNYLSKSSFFKNFI